MGSRRVLICDDERHVLRLLEVNLLRQGYDVTCAGDGGQAIDLLRASSDGDTEPFELGVIDALMPVADGYEVLSWIRTHETTQAMRVIVMVPSADDRAAWEEKPHRADMYIVKPFNPLTLF